MIAKRISKEGYAANAIAGKRTRDEAMATDNLFDLYARIKNTNNSKHNNIGIMHTNKNTVSELRGLPPKKVPARKKSAHAGIIDNITIKLIKSKNLI
jgi:hypothetical protein